MHGNGRASTLITENTRMSILDDARWAGTYLDAGVVRIEITKNTTHAILHNMRRILFILHRNRTHDSP